jgi:hypothetical protein
VSQNRVKLKVNHSSCTKANSCGVNPNKVQGGKKLPSKLMMNRLVARYFPDPAANPTSAAGGSVCVDHQCSITFCQAMLRLTHNCAARS